MAVPESLVAIIEGYIGRLRDDERAVLSAAAVCGVEFRAATVAYALERDASWVEQTCERLAHERLWLAAPRAGEGSDAADLAYAFRHALVRQVLHERTGPLVRAELHRRVGAALERERTAGVPVVAAELAMHFERGREPMTALRYHAEAAEAALERLSPAECASLTERGLALIEQAPDGTERKALEVTLATLRGVSLAHLRGLASAEAKGALQRAHALLGDVPQHPMRGRLLHGLGFVLCLRAEYHEALALAERADALASATNDPVPLLCACTVQADVHLLQGRPRAGRAWAERGLAAVAALDAPPERSFLTDPQATLLGLLAMHLLHLGLVESGRARLREAHARAREGDSRWRGWPHSGWTPCSRYGSATPSASGSWPTRCTRSSTSSRWCKAEPRAAGFAAGRTPERGSRATAIAASGRRTKRTRGSGWSRAASETMGYAVEALVLAGDWNAAQRELDEVLQFADRHGERVYLPQLFLMGAAIARARGDSDAGRTWASRAVEEARAQEAPWLELIALVELCECHGATAEDRRVLAALVDRLPEAGETAAVTRARALLDRNKPARATTA